MPEETQNRDEVVEQEIIQNYAKIPVNYSFSWTELKK